MLSISVGGISLILLTWNPSTMNSGSLLCVIEPPPRTRILTAASGEPSVVTTLTPARRPVMALEAEVVGMFFNVFSPTEEIAPVKSFLRALP